MIKALHTLMLVFLLGASVFAAQMTVTKTADTNDGVCNSDCSLREAVAAAAAGDTIIFAAPLFDTAQTVQVSGQITIDKNLTITGRAPALTTIANVAAAGSSSRIFVVTNATATISGVTITGGNPNAGSMLGCNLGCGGAIISNARLTLDNVIVSGNSAGSGGAIANTTGGTLTLTNSIVSGNTAGVGGAIFNIASASIVNATISGNATTNGNGGGIFNGDSLTIVGSTIADNRVVSSSAPSGGGIYHASPISLKISNSTIALNTVSGTGAILASGGGGGIGAKSGSVMIDRTTISGNVVTTGAKNGIGGGIYFGATLPDSTITNSTIAFNSVTGAPNGSAGGGIDTFGFTIGLRNSIVSFNTSGTSPNVRGNFTPNDSNIIGGEASVRLAPLANYGGATQTHALLPGSSAINAGNNCVKTLNGCPNSNPLSPLTADQRGRAHVGTVDIGAFEAPSGLVVTKTADTSDGVCDADCSLREAVAAANGTATDESITFDIPSGDAGCISGVCTITLTNGEIAVANASTAGVLFISNTKGTRDNLIVSGNNASRIFNIAGGGDLTANGVTLTRGRDASATGGAVTNSGSFKLFGSAVTASSAANGGGLSNSGELVTDNSTISGNSAINTGGGIVNNGGKVSLLNSFVSGNSANGGGGIYSQGSTLNVTNSTISGNSSSNANGGGIYNDGGALNVTNSTVNGNSTSRSDGGGIYNSNGTANVTNSTVSGNSASNSLGGGGIINLGGTTNLTNSTVSGNFASNVMFGGGIYIVNGLVRARNTIISGNTAGTGPDLFGTLAFSENNLTGGTVSLAPLGFYGGPTQTYPLLSTSTAAINTGNNCVLTMTCATFNAPVPLTTDQRGAERVGTVDIGAFEVNDSANGGTFKAILPTGRAGFSYASTLVPTVPANTTYSVSSGTLPTGLSLGATALAGLQEDAINGPQAGVGLSGTPTLGGLFNFTITATNSGGGTSATEYQLLVNVPTAAGIAVEGRVLTSTSRGVTNAFVMMTEADGQVRTVKTAALGYFRFDDVAAGQTVVLNVKSRKFGFAPKVVFLSDSVGGIDFVGIP